MGLRASIYSSGSNCSNGGISSRVTEVTIINAEGPFEPSEDAPAVRVVKRNIGGEYLHIEPVEPVPSGKVGYMHGGCIVSTSDSRFPSRYPLNLHDRTE